jgi:class 3 adenylate cyclase
VGVVTVERVVECVSDVGPLWDRLTDTEYLNRAAGLVGPLTLEKLNGAGAERYRVRTRAGGFDTVYDERPFEWVYRKSYRVHRRMLAGPVTSVETSFLFAPGATGGTRVTMRLDLAAKYGILTPVVRWGSRRTLGRLEEAVRSLDAAIEAGKPPQSSPGQVAAEALERARVALGKLAPPELADRLSALVREARDDELSRIRPYELAAAWQADRRAVLSACLQAVRAGLLELRWEVVCPSCRTASDSLPTLSALSGHGECHLCEIGFQLDLDEAVEATFQPTAAVRRIDAGQYCVGGPARTPHVMAQAILPARGEARLEAPPEPGRYRLFVRGGGAAVPVEVTPDAPAELVLDADGAPPERSVVAPGGIVRVRSARDDERHCKLERAQFPRLAATAREVTALPGFRRDFSAEVLRPDLSLKVSRVALFFSDLTASTQLYSNVGDAAAFKLVLDHFEVVTALLERHGGTLVKTIGDAVMAVFADELDGLTGSLAILEAFEGFVKGHPDRAQTHIKLGLYGGPSYLVTANGVLDYFGQTVNIAARLQAEAKSGELVVEAELADQAIAAGRLPPERVKERYDARLKGVDKPVKVARISVR